MKALEVRPEFADDDSRLFLQLFVAHLENLGGHDGELLDAVARIETVLIGTLNAPNGSQRSAWRYIYLETQHIVTNSLAGGGADPSYRYALSFLRENADLLDTDDSAHDRDC